MKKIDTTNKQLEKEQEEVFVRLINYCFDKSDSYRAQNETRKAKAWMNAGRRILEENDTDYYELLSALKYFPVTADEFLNSKEFLGDRKNILPAIKQKFIECNPDLLIGEKPVNQIIDTGAIGVGKTYSMILNCCYSLYFHYLIRDVNSFFNLDRDTKLMAVLVGDGALGTRTTLYEPTRDMFTNMPFTTKHIGYDTQVESVLKLDNGIILAPQLAGSDQWKKAMAIFFAGLDESNRQPVTKRSAKAEGGEQIYDQARTNYDLTLNRLTSRFGKKNLNLHKLFLAGSARRKESMIEVVIKELKESGFDNYKIYRNRQFDIHPKNKYQKKKFTFCMSSEKYSPHVIKEGEDIAPDMRIVDDNPMDYYGPATLNPDKYQRDVLGQPTDAIDSYIGDSNAIAAAFSDQVKSIVYKENVTLGEDADPDTYLKVNKENLPSLKTRKETPYWVSVDLSKSQCATGISMTYISHIENIDGVLQPHFRTILCASIIPKNGIEIRNEKIRRFIIELRDKWKFNIAGVSFDTFNSTECLQQLSDAGFAVAEISTVRDMQPFEDLKESILQHRIKICPNAIAEKEAKELEITMVGNREVVEKSISGSKDIVDTLAATVHYAFKSAHLAKLRLMAQRGATMERRNVRGKRGS